MRFFKNKLGTGFELVEPDTVYIHLPRCHGKTFTTMNHIAKFAEQGKRVKIIDYNRVNKNGSTYKPTMLDFDFIGNNPRSLAFAELCDDIIATRGKRARAAVIDDYCPYQLEPTWAVGDDGSLRLKEISLVKKGE